MSRVKPNAATPAMDVGRIARQFRDILSSRAGASNSPPSRALTNADVFEAFQNDILAARRLGVGWQEIADELARAGVHKKNGSLFTGVDIRIYSGRKLKDLAPPSAPDRSEGSALLPSAPDTFMVPSRLRDVLNRAETLSSALRPAHASGAHDEAVLRVLMRVDAVSSSRMDGLRPPLEDMLDLEARGVADESLGRKRSLLSVRRYVDALEQFSPIVRQAGPAGLTPVLIQQLQDAVTGQRPDELSAERGIPDAERSGRVQNATDAPARGPSACGFEQISRSARGKLPEASAPALLRIAIAHAQHDTALRHTNGEGRIGRLFLTLMLAAYGLNHVLVSNVIEARKTDYVSALRTAQRDQKWEPLVCFLGEAVITAARQVDSMARALNDLPVLWKYQTAFRKGSVAQRALDVLPYYPVLTVALLAKLLDVNATAANRAIAKLSEQGIVVERKGQQQSRTFSVPDALNIISAPLGNAADFA